MAHETDYDERRRPTRNSRMSKRRADGGEGKSDASEPPPHGDERAGRRRGGETARHDRRCNDTARELGLASLAARSRTQSKRAPLTDSSAVAAALARVRFRRGS